MLDLADWNWQSSRIDLLDEEATSVRVVEIKSIEAVQAGHGSLGLLLPFFESLMKASAPRFPLSRSTTSTTLSDNTGQSTPGCSDDQLGY